MHYFCEYLQTYLGLSRANSMETEIIDLLQGRISNSVFVNHYYRPDINEIITKKIRLVLDKLLKEIR
jgi:hypothetical protein